MYISQIELEQLKTEGAKESDLQRQIQTVQSQYDMLLSDNSQYQDLVSSLKVNGSKIQAQVSNLQMEVLQLQTEKEHLELEKGQNEVCVYMRVWYSNNTRLSDV